MSVQLSNLNAMLAQATAQQMAPGVDPLTASAAEAELFSAVKHQQLFKGKVIPWKPADSGFVCS